MNARYLIRTAPLVTAAGALALSLFLAVPVRAEVYAGVEVGGKGVKATVVDVSGDGATAEIAVKLADTTNTGLATDVARDGRFGATALAETVKAVGTYTDRFRKEFAAAPGRIYVVGSSGLFAAILDKPELIKENQTRLADAVKERTGVAMTFIDARRESELSIVGVVPKKDRAAALLIDVGGGNTKGGCEVGPGKFATFAVPFGTATFAELANKAGAADAKAMKALCDDKVVPLLKAQLSGLPDLAKRDRVYLSGGVAWAAATFARPTDAKPFTTLTLKDVEAFEAKLGADPAAFPEPDLSAADDEGRRRALAEWARVKKVYTPEQLLAGAQVLRSAIREAGEGKHFFFARNGYLGWILAYVTESAVGGK